MKSPAGYYTRTLAGLRLKRCYDLAPPRVQQYFEAEIAFVLSKIRPQDRVLDLGCGYGRILNRLAERAGFVVGIDTSAESLAFGRDQFAGSSQVRLLQMDAIQMAFADGTFDLTLCIQNGISAFHVDKLALLAESLHVTRPGGRMLFSTYAEAFWPDRLHWFRRQAAEGLVGEIDEAATGHGVIVCRDGFTATTVSEVQSRSLCSGLGCIPTFHTVDASSLFCEISA